MTPPNTMPINRELMTSRVQKANTMAAKGGKMDNIPK